jgi:hypothetical protein
MDIKLSAREQKLCHKKNIRMIPNNSFKTNSEQNNQNSRNKRSMRKQKVLERVIAL